ncbi:MAG TPA: TetR/AcrR family transcriptional regulator [Draconibacterium sp.]|nr:TetR/AcrR family transcriptional regulator [Draconibacterium sp.]HRX10808.1 TetR/AcrR family transcriptional regulator [Draconibacterium sp.]
MATQINNQFNDLSTEEKIKNSARAVFHRKGFAAARTRDIAQEAGINLALLNYYFRSKEKLFNIVMLEAFQSFFSSISIVFNDANSTLDEKIRKFAADYIDLLFQEPEIPLFIMSEIRNNPDELLQKIDLKSVVFGSVFFNQYNEAIRQGKIKNHHFLHFMMNFMGLIAFPFIAKPLLKEINGLSEVQYNEIVAERKALIPVWMDAMMTI